MAKDDQDRLATIRKRFSYARDAWTEIRADYNTDLKMVCGDQWKPDIKQARDNSDRPALTDNRLASEVHQITNRCRQNRPQPHINPSDDIAQQETAEILEGHLRHIQDASQADVAYDTSVEYAAAGGFGVLRVCAEYINEYNGDDSEQAKARLLEQEPRLRAVLDPTTVYFDPDFEEPDASDGNWCFVRKKFTHDQYREEFGAEIDPQDFEGSDNTLADWGDKEHVWVAEYWEVTKKTLFTVGDRKVQERKVTCEYIDGIRILKKYDWAGKWIPIIPVLAQQMIVDGKRKLISAVRNARDPQKLLNLYESGIAQMINMATKAPWTGPKGAFKDPAWADANNTPYAYMEWEPVYGADGQLVGKPERNQFEAPIQALSAAAAQQIEAIKASFGYIDNLRPSQPLSGIAVTRRSDAQDLTNFHFEDNLARAQWHTARVILDLDIALADTPRVWRTLKADNRTAGKAAVTRKQGGYLPGIPPEQHHTIDLGVYTANVSTGPSYNTKREEERDVLLHTLQADPQLWTAFGDLLFKLMGYQELEERAKMLLPAPIQQAMAGQKQQIPPAIQAQLAQMMQQNAMLKQGLQQVIEVLKTKQIEAAGKLQVEHVKAVKDITVEQMKAAREAAHQSSDHKHEATLALMEFNQRAIERLTELLHESELSPTPGPGMGNNAEPQPAGAGGATA